MTACPGCGWPGNRFLHPNVQVCINPACQVFTWTLDPGQKATALRLVQSLPLQREP